MESTGTSVLDNRNDAIMAKPTAIESGTNRDRVTPVIKKEGTNTARMESIASRRGTSVAFVAFKHGTRDGWLDQQLAVNIFDGNCGFIDQDADSERQPSERHDVDGLPGRPQSDHSAEQARTEWSRR